MGVSFSNVFSVVLAQLAGVVEYTDSIAAEG